MMKKVLLLLLVISLSVQAKIVTKKYPNWSITCTMDQGLIVPNTPISVVTNWNHKCVEGVYINSGYVECAASSPNISIIKYKIQNEEGRLNPKNKVMPTISFVNLLLADEVNIGEKKFAITENTSTYTLTSEEGIKFPQGNVVYPPTIIGEPQSISLQIVKDSLIRMYNADTEELKLYGQFPAVLIYKNGRAEALISVKDQELGVVKATINMNSGEQISVDYLTTSYPNRYAITEDGIKLRPYWYEKFIGKTKPNEGETLTHYYHRAYTADSIYNVQKEKEELERKKKEQEKINNKQRRNNLITQVEALGETPYHKALVALTRKYTERFQKECWMPESAVLDGITASGVSLFISGFSNNIQNRATCLMVLGGILLEAVKYSPLTSKKIWTEFGEEIEQPQLLKLRKPIEEELEDIELDIVNKTLSNIGK